MTQGDMGRKANMGDIGEYMEMGDMWRYMGDMRRYRGHGGVWGTWGIYSGHVGIWRTWNKVGDIGYMSVMGRYWQMGNVGM